METDVRTAIINPEVVIAFISFVVAPVVTVLVSNRKSKTKAVEKVANGAIKSGSRPADSSAAFSLFMDWASTQTGRDQDYINKLRKELRGLYKRVSELERTMALLQQQNLVLVTQVKQLGGEPFTFDDVAN